MGVIKAPRGRASAFGCVHVTKDKGNRLECLNCFSQPWVSNFGPHHVFILRADDNYLSSCNNAFFDVNRKVNNTWSLAESKWTSPNYVYANAYYKTFLYSSHYYGRDTCQWRRWLPVIDDIALTEDYFLSTSLAHAHSRCVKVPRPPGEFCRLRSITYRDLILSCERMPRVYLL